jgi:single-strand DNA-binding protein
MASRSLNKVMLIGNVTRDPELRYTPQNTAVCKFSVATNRTWTGGDGSQQEAAEFTPVVTWGKLAEISNQILKKGRKVYVEGRLQTHAWENKEGVKQKSTEVIADQVIALDAKPGAGGGSDEERDFSYPEEEGGAKPAPKKKKEADELAVDDNVGGVDDIADDIPF